MFNLVLTMQKSTMKVSSTHSLLDEHFVGFSVLPGAFSIVACVDSVINELKASDKKDYKLRKIKKFSFLRPILPGLILDLNLIKISEVGQTKHVYISLDDSDSQSYLKALLVLGRGL